MRITFVLPSANLSGGIKVVAIYAKLLSEMGHQVVVISRSGMKIPVRRKFKMLLQGRGWPQNSAKRESHMDGVDLDHRIVGCSRELVNDDVPDADVIIATWWETAEWIMQLNSSKGAKVYFIQGHEIHAHLPVERSRSTYSLPFHKIVVARWLQDVMSTEYGDRIVDVVPNSVDHDQFFAEPRGKQLVPTIGFLYSPKYIKGLDVTLKAISVVRDKIPSLRIISFGTDNMEQGVDKKIEFHQTPAQKTIRDLYSLCDVWVTASRTEGFNLPAMEAMACRTPVVSTRVGWPEEAVVDYKNGFLVSVDDAKALADRIEEVLMLSEDAWMNMSRNAYDTVATSSWLASAILFEDALLHACERARKGEISGSCAPSG